MNEDLKALIDTYYSLADAMAAQGLPGDGESLKTHMVMVSVAVAAAGGSVRESEINCIREYLDYPLTKEIVHENILPAKLDKILTRPPVEIYAFVAAEKNMAGAEEGPGTADMFIKVVDSYLTEMIMADGDADENETWIKDKYISMLKSEVKKTRKKFKS